MSAFKYQWNQTIDVGTAGLLSKQWTSIRHILSLLVTANACVHVTAYVAVRRSLSTTYTAVVLGLLLRQYVSYQFGVWAVYTDHNMVSFLIVIRNYMIWYQKLRLLTVSSSLNAPPSWSWIKLWRFSGDFPLYISLPNILYGEQIKTERYHALTNRYMGRV